jgi:hypothetical protein
MRWQPHRGPQREQAHHFICNCLGFFLKKIFGAYQLDRCLYYFVGCSFKKILLAVGACRVAACNNNQTANATDQTEYKCCLLRSFPQF